MTKNRHLSHFDIAPLLLFGVGINADKFGPRRNLLSQKTLLEIFGENLGDLASAPNLAYENFWHR